MFENLSPGGLNALFMDAVESGNTKTAQQAGATYIKGKLREAAVCFRVQPPMQVTKEQLRPAKDHEGFTRLIDIEPDTQAVVLDFRSQPSGQWVTSRKAEVVFWTISSKRFQKVEQELLAWEMPITKVLEMITVKELQTQTDKCHTKLTEDAMVAEILANRLNKNIGIEVTSNDPFPAKRGFQRRADLIRLLDTMDGDALPVGTLVMTKVMFNSYSALPATEVGSITASEVTVDGYRYNELMGVKCVTTIKTGPKYNYLYYPNEIFLYTEPDYLGRIMILNNVKFWIKKEANLIEWQSWYDLGMLLAAGHGVGRLVYYKSADNYTDKTLNPYKRVLFTAARTGLSINNKDPRNIPFSDSF